MISNKLLCNYMNILKEVVDKRVQSDTQVALAENFRCSRNTIRDFESGKTINFELLDQYCAMFGIHGILVLGK